MTDKICECGEPNCDGYGNNIDVGPGPLEDITPENVICAVKKSEERIRLLLKEVESLNDKMRVETNVLHELRQIMESQVRESLAANQTPDSTVIRYGSEIFLNVNAGCHFVNSSLCEIRNGEIRINTGTTLYISVPALPRS